MKKFFYFVLSTLVFVSCSQSPEQKAEVLIKESLKKSLYKPDTYKPVETKVDSAFAPYDDPAFYEVLVEIGELNTEFNELTRKAKMAKSSMSIHSGPYQTAFSRNEYAEAKKEYDEAQEKREKVTKKFLKKYDKVVEMMNGERKFIGYKVFHNYRADNNAGQTLIGNGVFFIDENFTEVKMSMAAEEYDMVRKSLEEVKEQLEELKEEEE